MFGPTGGAKTGPSPVDRRRAGSKHHVICEGQDIPRVTLSAGNRNDITELIPLVDRVPPTGHYGKFRPKALLADRAYDSRAHRKALRERGITPRIAKRGTSHGSGLGKERWVVEQTISWLHANRRLERRYDRRDDIHEAFLTIGCALICLKHLQSSL
jgi:transposase